MRRSSSRGDPSADRAREARSRAGHRSWSRGCSRPSRGSSSRELGLEPGNAFVVWDELRAGRAPHRRRHARHVGPLDAMDLGLAGKVAIVTGSSRGIGRGIATAPRRRGCRRRPLRARRGRARCRGAARSPARGGRSASSRTSRRRTARRRSSRRPSSSSAGSTSSSTTSAAPAPRRSTTWMPPISQAVLDKNLFPALNVSRAALPVLRARGGGVIAMIASIWGREGGGGPSYNIAKAAEISLAKAMARDLAKDGIRVLQRRSGLDAVPGRQLGAAPPGRPRGHGGVHRARASLRSPRHGRRGRRRGRRSSSHRARRGSSGTCVSVDGGQSRSF